jgi:para-nitrobenzyl esterase
VYVPAAPAPPGGFPVMIFWYGGSWTYGGASFPLYDGETDVALMKDVILVAANYRLNVFGYLAGDELLAESADKSVGNYGFQDQRAVMTWVRDEIANFGGDPTQVTIFGESAGGGSVSNHLVSPRSRGLFARAAIESGSFASWTAQPYNISRTRLPQVARNLKCTGSGAPLLVCLRAVNETALLAADHDLTEAFLEWSPVIDGVEVLDDPRALAKAGAIAPVPVLLGFNADEGTLFNDSPTDLNATDYEAAIATDIGPVLAPEVVALYPLAQYESPWWAICAILRDSQMLCPGLDTARWVSTAPVPQSSFAYFYTQVLILTDFIDLFRNLRCFHGSELVSVFDFSVLLWNDEEVAMAKTFVGYWTNFARFGDPADPRGAPVPAWPVYASGAGQNVAVISAGDKVSANVTIVTGGLRGTECAFWDNVTIPPNTVWGPCNATTGCVPHASGLT